jgi:signal transduction histidine kinase
MKRLFVLIRDKVKNFLLSVPVMWKIIGIGILPVIILGVSLNYWVTTGLSDWLSYILTDVRVEAAMAAGSRSVLFVTGIGALLSMILLALMVNILTSPILALKRTAEMVAGGSIETRADVWAKDEIGSLAISINQMIDNLVAIQKDLATSNRQLEAINRIADAADREMEIHDVIFIALENILDLLDLEFGWVYFYDPEIHKHHLASWKDVPKKLQDILLDVETEALCTSQVPIEIDESTSRVVVHPCNRLLAAGYREEEAYHITIPIEARSIHFGVINLYYPSRNELSQDVRETLESIGNKVSEVVASAWLQIKLKEKEAARMLLLQSLVTAQEDERKHLARELHDQAGQSLTSLLIRLKAMEKNSGDSGLSDELTVMQKLVSDTIDQIRDLSYRLRPPSLEEFGLGTAISALAEDLTGHSSMKIKFKNRLKDEPPDDIAMVLYRIVQEGLTNVVRHAEADQVVINMEPRKNLIYMKIEDDGKGFDPGEITPTQEKRHLGLISMHERAELVGGNLIVYSAPDEGTTIEIQVPLPEKGGDYGFG